VWLPVTRLPVRESVPFVFPVVLYLLFDGHARIGSSGESVDVGAPQLGAGVRTFLRRIRRVPWADSEVCQVGDLGDPYTLAGFALGVVGRGPRPLPPAGRPVTPLT
jgi:hypothetical protein